MPNTVNHPQGQNVDFEQLYRENRLALGRFIAYRVSDRDAAEDLAAEVVCQMMEYCTTLRVPVRNPRALLYRIARRRIMQFYDERGRRRREVPIEDAPPAVAPGSLLREAMAREDVEAMQLALGDIREEYREALVLSTNIGLTIAELAEMMEKSEVNIRVLLFRARRALERALRDRGYIDR